MSEIKNKKLLLRVIGYFCGWRIFLFLIAFLATVLVVNFGNRFPYVDRVLEVTNLPNWIWGFGNFDGVHYLRIAQDGYSAQYSQAFFPLYPLLIRFFNFLPKGDLDITVYTDPSYFYTGIVLSAVFFILALYFLIKLWSEEYGLKTAVMSIFLLLSFPTAFYFGAIYSESLFLLLSVLVFWLTKKDKYILAGFFALLASATKVQGIFLALFLVIELWEKYKKGVKEKVTFFWRDLIGVLISPLGLMGYMYYLYRVFGNPIYFLTAQPAFGAERSSVPFILLPQVIYRYIKMFFSLEAVSLNFWNVALEFTVTLAVIIGLVLAFRKIRFSYWIFMVLAIITPTLTGTFSSMPRYALLAFLLLPLVARFKKAYRYIIIAEVTLQVVLLSLFIRGYWVA